MPRLLGVDIPNDKKTYIALTYLHGIGQHSAREVCKATGIEADLRAKELTDDDLSRLASHLENNYVIEGSLRRQRTQNIARLRDIRSYRGLRHRMGLPVRGQRTRTNARTRKGPRKTVAGKKSVKELGG
jgi:small subunit ribosomal protein S13